MLFTKMSKGSALAIMLAATGAAAASNVTVTEMAWGFYQGGYWEIDPGTWVVKQDHYTDSPRTNHVFVDAQGAAFHSLAGLQLHTRQSMRSIVFMVDVDLRAQAWVSEEQPQGVAHAFAAFSSLYIRFDVETESTYLGEPLLYGEDDQVYEYGDVLPPGEYVHFMADPFPAEMAETTFVGSGGREEDELSHELRFEFMAMRPTLGMRSSLQSLAPMLPFVRAVR